MPRRIWIRTLLVVLVSASAAPLAVQWLTLPTPGLPRTADGRPDLAAPAPRGPDGRPDLTGVWMTRSLAGDLGDRSRLVGLDLQKLQPWAQAFAHQQAESFFTGNPAFHCRPRGPANFTMEGMSNGGMRRIVQHPTLLAILNVRACHRMAEGPAVAAAWPRT